MRCHETVVPRREPWFLLIFFFFFAVNPTPPIPALPRGFLIPLPCSIHWACCFPVTPTLYLPREQMGCSPAAFPVAGPAQTFPIPCLSHGSCSDCGPPDPQNLVSQPRGAAQGWPVSIPTPQQNQAYRREWKGGLGPSRQLRLAFKPTEPPSGRLPRQTTLCPRAHLSTFTA